MIDPESHGKAITALSEQFDDNATGQQEAEAKTRKCLLCKEDFLSAWAGERICPRCKNKQKWRRG